MLPQSSKKDKLPCKIIVSGNEQINRISFIFYLIQQILMFVFPSI